LFSVFSEIIIVVVLLFFLFCSQFAPILVIKCLENKT
jgi:hypothetical protein